MTSFYTNPNAYLARPGDYKEANEARTVELLDMAERMPGWERLGTNFDPNLNIGVVDAFNAAGLAWEANKEPLYRRGLDGELIEVPGQYALINSTSGDLLDVVSNRYEVIDNMRLAEYLEPCRSWGPVVTAGNTGRNGKTAFVVFRGEDFEVHNRNARINDVLRRFYVVRETKQAGFGLTFEEHMLRLRCINGAISYDTQKMLATIAHGKGANGIARYIGEAVGAMGNLTHNSSYYMNQFAATPINSQGAVDYFKDVIVYPQEPRELVRMRELRDKNVLDADGRERLFKAEQTFVERVEATAHNRKACLATYEGECADQGIAGTLYGAFQALLAVCDHRKATKKAAHSAVFGEHRDIKVRGFKMALDVAGLSRN